MKRAMWLLGLAAAVVCLAWGVEKIQFAATEKAFYADLPALNFVRPGLTVKVLSALIATDGTIAAKVRITDLQGVPLDREGIFSPGPVALSFVAAFLPQDQNQYTSYTTRIQTSPITRVSAIQGAADTGGVWTKTDDGEYTYTFRTKAPAGFDATTTHTIGVYGNRNLTEFDLGTNYFSTTFNFVPAGGAVTKVRDVVRSQGCNACHTQINAHGGSRRGLDMCVLCHNPQSSDPDTGNTIDMTVMTHKIHMGKELPSVVAGGKYSIIGFNQTEVNFSDIGFPAGTRNCTACHIQTGAGAGTQAANMYIPSQAACGSCHDGITFAAGKGHIVQTDDSRCSQCHRPEGEREWDISVKGAHVIPEASKNLKGQSIEFVEVRNVAPGQRPVVTYKLKDSTGATLAPTDMTSLSLVLGGPATDYSGYWSEAARTDPTNPGGTATHTFARAIPDDATGTFSISVEGYRNVSFEGPRRIPTTVRDPLKNVVTYFNVLGKAVEKRREIVALAKCNACHSNLEAHGRNRNQIEHCVVCHNPTMTDAARRPADKGPNEAISFTTMIHRLHTASSQGRPYVIYGFGGTANDFSDITLPTDAANCSTCHVNNSQALPLKAGLQTVTDPRGFLPTLGAASAACLSCHSSKEAASHVLLNTSELGESCTVCHGPTAEFSVNKVHAR